MKRKMLSLVLALGMTAPALPAGVLAAVDGAEDIAADSNVICSFDFDDGVIPEGFTSENDGYGKATMIAEKGRLVYRTSSTAPGKGMRYDISAMESIAAQKSEKLVFEYDMYPEVLSRNSARYFYTRINDDADKSYTNFFIEANTDAQKIYSPTGNATKNIVAWDKDSEDVDKYYKIRITLDAMNDKQSIQIAEMNADGTSESTDWQYLIKDQSYSSVDTNGSLQTFWLFYAGVWADVERVSYDNFKIYKDGAYEDLDCTAANGGALANTKRPNIGVEFNNKVDAETISGITLKKADGNEVQATVKSSGKAVALIPQEDLAAGETYTVTVGTDVKDMYGQTLASEKTLSYAIDENLLVFESFDDGTVPAKFGYTEQTGAALTAANGALRYSRLNSVNAAGRLWYDISELESLEAQNCDRLIFEADMTYEGVKYHSNQAYYTDTFNPIDTDGKGYTGVYMQTEGKSAILVTAEDDWQFRPAIKAWNLASENDGVYYKFRLTLDAKTKEHKFEVAEMTAETAEPEYKSFGELPFKEGVDGTLEKLNFSNVNNWCNLTLEVDNFKIYKETDPAEEVTTEIEVRDGKAYVTVTNTKYNSVTFVNICAKYAGSAISGVETNQWTLTKGESKTFDYSLGSNETAKTYTWNSIAGMKPVK